MHRYELPFWPTFGSDFDPGPKHIAMLAQCLAEGRHRDYIRLIHPNIEAQPDRPIPGLAENPLPKHANSRWREWRDDYLGWIAEEHPDNPGVHIERHDVDLVLRWREAIPPDWRIWEHD